MKVQHTATLDFTDNGVFETGWRIKQGDYGNTELVLRLVNNGVNVYDAEITPQIAFRRWDGASVISIMTPNDQTYKYAFAGNELEVPGLTLCDVKFTDAEGRVSTASCRFTVAEDTIGYDPTGAHTYDNPVSELVEQATNAAEVGIESSFKAEGFAVGEQGGVPVGPDSPYYHNNAKWWAQQAGDPIGTAVEEQTTTTGQFTTKTGGKLESCIVAFEPIQSGSGTPSPSNVRPITGHSSVEVWEHGKNLLNPTLISQTYNGITIVNNGDGTYTFSGKNTLSGWNGIYMQTVDVATLPSRTLKFVGCPSTGSDSSYRLQLDFYNGNTFISSIRDYGSGVTVTIPDNATNIRPIFYVYNNYQISGSLLVKPMLTTDANATYDDYVSYQGQDVTVNLGGTYYGGSLDVVSGVLTVTHAHVDLGSYTWYKTNANLFYAEYPRDFKKAVYASGFWYANGVCECYKFIQNSITSDDGVINLYFEEARSFYRMFVNDSSRYTLSASDFKTAVTGQYLVYELATPLTIQLTPQQINTLIGENHLDVPLEGQTLDSAVYRELFAWDDVEDVVELRLPISAIGTDESNNDNASQAYSQGDYFYKNGIAKAKTNIASGATFTLGTNYEIKTLAEILKTLES
jgi:hypothetical protein